MKTTRAKLILFWLLVATLSVACAYYNFAVFLFLPLLIWLRSSVPRPNNSRWWQCRQQMFIRMGIVTVVFLALELWDNYFPFPRLVERIGIWIFTVLYFSIIAYPDYLLIKDSSDNSARKGIV